MICSRMLRLVNKDASGVADRDLAVVRSGAVGDLGEFLNPVLKVSTVISSAAARQTTAGRTIRIAAVKASNARSGPRKTMPVARSRQEYRGQEQCQVARFASHRGPGAGHGRHWDLRGYRARQICVERTRAQSARPGTCGGRIFRRSNNLRDRAIEQVDQHDFQLGPGVGFLQDVFGSLAVQPAECLDDSPPLA